MEFLGYWQIDKKINDRTDSTKKILVYYKNYTPENTILNFRNFLTLSTSEKFDREFYIDNGFYVSQIMQLDESHFLGKYQYPDYEYPYSDNRWFYTHNITPANLNDQ